MYSRRTGGHDEGDVAGRKSLRREAAVKFFAELSPCTVGIEACTCAHDWAQEITALGHTVRLMPPAHVKPYLKRRRNDAAGAGAICKAVMRPAMHFVPMKSAERRENDMIYKMRELLMRQRTQLINALRGHLAETGIETEMGIGKLDDLVAIVCNPNDGRLPPPARLALEELSSQTAALEPRIAPVTRRSPLRWDRARLDAG